MRNVFGLSGLVVLLFAAKAVADEAGRWLQRDGVPFPARVRSFVVAHEDQPLLRGPMGDAPVRGSAMAGSKLPIFATRRGTGCAGFWLLVGPLAWLCQSQGALTEAEPDAAGLWPPQERDGLPFAYYFVGPNGTQGYSQLAFIEEASPEQDLQPGFAVALVEQRTKNQEVYGKTHHGLWVPVRDLIPVRASPFHGEELADGRLDVAWSIDDKTPVFMSFQGGTRAKDLPTFRRLQHARILEEKGIGNRAYVRIDATHWIRANDLRRPQRVSAPAVVAAGERWIDVELASQTLVAYEGDQPVFATLVSTGRGAPGTPTATPKGIHRIWVKLRSSTMDNLEDETAKAYALEDVPYVQFFAKGVGLHGAFWHQGFGQVRSHGCVNLAPLDAQRLFAFTGPKLPTGWTAALPHNYELGTVVQIR